MRGGKDDEKVTASPMFPRLHVNDTEKGGPRAPPRNKMALYEQLSVPSQRFSSGSASLLLPPNNDGSSLVPSMSSSNGGGYERSVFTQFCNSPAPSHLAEKIHSLSSSGMKLNTMMANQECKSMKPANSHSFASGPLSPTARCRFRPSNLSNFKNFLSKKLGDEDDIRVSSNNQLDHERRFKLREGPGDLKSRLYVRNRIEDNADIFQPSQDPVGRSASIHSNKDRNLEDESSSWSLKVRTLKSLKRTYSSMNQETRSGSMDVLNGLHGTNVHLNRECLAVRDEISLQDGIEKVNAFNVRNDSCSPPSLEDDDNDDTSPNGLENGSECREDKNGRPIQVREVDRRQDNVSNTCMMDSVSVLGLSPDEVVGVIGEKQFWKARRALINQQRVFAVQVFELHRLMKVQKLIARSPHLLLDDQLYMNKHPLNMSRAKKLPPKYILEASPRIVKPKDTSQKLHLRTECADENAVGNLPLPSVNNDTCKGLVTQRSNFGSYTGNAPTATISRNIKPSPWCFPPPGNQWLVSVMSPSEGLVYKPCTGPCPPTAGFIAPFYGSCGPLSLTPAGGDFLSTAYGVPASHQQGIGILPGMPPLGQIYFPPYGMPVMNPSFSSSAAEQTSPFTGHQTKDDDLSVGDINFILPHQSSCNMPTQISRVASCCVGKSQAAKESEVQGSTASSPGERVKGDALPLFPMEPTVQASDQNAQTNEQQSQVIKVVPHNPRLATESAARIFQSIQEGRKQYD